MKIVKDALLIALFFSTTAMAAPASEESIKQLIAVTHAEKLVDNLLLQYDSIMKSVVQQTLNGKTPNAKQQQAIERLKNKLGALLQANMGWKKLEPLYLRLYQETFTEEEITGMLSFYSTPAGQALINKMPVLMQKSMQELPRMVTELMPEMKKINEEFVAEMSTADN